MSLPNKGSFDLMQQSCIELDTVIKLYFCFKTGHVRKVELAEAWQWKKHYTFITHKYLHSSY